MQRRDFLKHLGFLPLALMTPQLAFALAPQGNYRRLLVLIEFKGGNDGLNTVVPYADSGYYSLRPRLGVARDAVLQLDQATGLHPALQALMPLWQAKEVAIVQGVGYPEPNLSHFRSIEIWDTASAASVYASEGWLTRTFSEYPVPKSFAADGVLIGGQALGPLAGTGARAIALNNTQQFLRQAHYAGDANSGARNPALQHILKVENDIVQAAMGLAGSVNIKTEFPRDGFSAALKTAAQVIANQAGVAVVRVTHNGFDTHAGQAGAQQRLLQEFAAGMAAFKTALQELNRWNDTLIMSYSEFGRRPQENASGGTDHGTANAHFILGGAVRGGLYGANPDLQNLDSGNLRFGVDFRSLYATVIERWWGVNSRNALNGRFATLDVLKA